MKSTWQPFRALPAYLGGKRRLCPLVFAALAELLPRERWGDSIFLDPMCGGGSAALFAKAQGFRVIASDVAERATIVARALVANSSVRLRSDDVLDLFRDPGVAYPRVAAHHSPAVFTAAQAAWLDRALARANPRSEPVRSLLLLVIIKIALRCQPMSMLRGTDARAAASGDFDRVSPRRLGHYLKASRLLTPDGAWLVAQEVNAGVLGGRGEARKDDALTVISDTAADVVYLDPPYPGTTSYGREYAVLDALLGDDPAGRPPPALDDLLGCARHVPVVLLSYGGPTVTLEGLVAQVSRHRPVRRELEVPYRHLGSIASEEKNATNKEYLIVAGQ